MTARSVWCASHRVGQGSPDLLALEAGRLEAEAAAARPAWPAAVHVAQVVLGRVHAPIDLVGPAPAPQIQQSASLWAPHPSPAPLADPLGAGPPILYKIRVPCVLAGHGGRRGIEIAQHPPGHDQPRGCPAQIIGLDCPSWQPREGLQPCHTPIWARHDSQAELRQCVARVRTRVTLHRGWCEDRAVWVQRAMRCG